MLRIALLTLVACFGLVILVEFDRYRCTDRPLDEKELEGLLRERFNLSQVSLAQDPDGRFSGEGKGLANVTYRFRIVQDDKERVVKFESDNGSGVWTESLENNRFLYLLIPAFLVIAVIQYRERRKNCSFLE